MSGNNNNRGKKRMRQHQLMDEERNRATSSLSIQVQSNPMFEGRAIGGPLAKIKLTAGATWNGLVKRKGVNGDTLDTHYPGRYIWTTPDFESTTYTWVWVPSEVTTQEGKPKGHPQPRRHFHR